MSASPMGWGPLPPAPERPQWRQALDARIDRWMARPGLYRWAVSNPFTRWLTRRRADRLFEVLAGFVRVAAAASAWARWAGRWRPTPACAP